MSNAQLQALESYTRLMNTNAAAHVFRAAVEVGVFDALATGQKEAAEVAGACHAEEEPVELLLDALCGIGVVERYGDHFALAQVMHLLPVGLRDLGDRYWQHLVEFVRTGNSIPRSDTSEMDETDYRAEADASEWLMTPAALDVVRVLDIGGARRGLEILELAAGSAVWSLAMAHRDPESRLTVVDHADRLAAARSHAESIGLGDRVSWVEGDYRCVELPAAHFDLAILANVTHLETLGDNILNFKRLHDWIRPGGEVAVVDSFPGQEEGSLQYEVFRLGLALRTQKGRIHSPEQLSAALVQAGFESPQFAHLPSPPHIVGLMLGAKESSKTEN